MADEEEAEEEEAPSGGGGSKLPMILTVVNILITGFALFQVMGLGGKIEALAVANEGETVDPGVPLPVIGMDSFVVNLNENGRARYLKTKFDLQLGKADGEAAMEPKKMAIRDNILRYLSSLSVADTLGEDGKTQIGEELLKRINEILEDDKAVTSLYFSEFVVQ